MMYSMAWVWKRSPNRMHTFNWNLKCRNINCNADFPVGTSFISRKLPCFGISWHLGCWQYHTRSGSNLGCSVLDPAPCYCTWESITGWPKFLDPCHPHGRPGRILLLGLAEQNASLMQRENESLIEYPSPISSGKSGMPYRNHPALSYRSLLTWANQWTTAFSHPPHVGCTTWVAIPLKQPSAIWKWFWSIFCQNPSDSFS